jgi:hypothetical protein
MGSECANLISNVVLFAVELLLSSTAHSPQASVAERQVSHSRSTSSPPHKINSGGRSGGAFVRYVGHTTQPKTRELLSLAGPVQRLVHGRWAGPPLMGNTCPAPAGLFLRQGPVSIHAQAGRPGAGGSTPGRPETRGILLIRDCEAVHTQTVKRVPSGIRSLHVPLFGRPVRLPSSGEVFSCSGQPLGLVASGRRIVRRRSAALRKGGVAVGWLR